MASQADYILDFRGGISSISLLKITRIIQEMKPMECMEILGLDGDTLQDLFKVLADFAYEIIDAGDEKGMDCRLRIRKL